jgi:hypothetical protein
MSMNEDQAKAWQEVHDDVEAALFAVNDLDAETFDGGPRIKAIVATKLEETLLWVKRGMEKGAA